MYKIAPILLIILFLSSCKNEAALKHVHEELAVIHQTFEKATTAMSENDSDDMTKYIEKFRNSASEASLKATLSSSAEKRVHIYLTEDSLFSLRSFNIFQTPSDKEFIKKIDIDTLFTLLTEKIQKSVKVDLKTKTPIYQILSKEALTDEKNYNGTLRFSRVVFNKDQTKACYYFEQNILQHPGRAWVTGTVVFAEKKNGKWIYLKDEYLFTS